MDLNDIFNRLNFYVNKYTGSFFTIPELENMIDSGSLAVYSDFKPKYATSQLVKDALSPFRATYDFNPTVTISGYISVPSNTGYLDLLDIQIQFDISTRIMYFPVEMINEDERANRLNSQIDPVTVTSPVGEQIAPRFFKLYPTAGYTGTVTFLRRPVKPVYASTTISGRVIVYDQANSVQLEWRDSEVPEVMLKSLLIAGINLTAEDIVQISQLKTTDNFNNANRL